MEALLDTNFMISCVKLNIDFLEELENLGFKAVISREVIQEMKDLRLKVSHDERVAIDIALVKIEDKKVHKNRLGARTIDEGLIAKGKEGIYIATLDTAIKRVVPNKIVISDSQKKLIIERA